MDATVHGKAPFFLPAWRELVGLQERDEWRRRKRQEGMAAVRYPSLPQAAQHGLTVPRGPSACLWRACKCAFLMGPNHEHMSTRGTSVNNVIVLCPSAPRLPLKRGSFPAEPHMASGQRQRVKKNCRTGSTAETERRTFLRRSCFDCSVAPSVCSVTPSPSLLAPFPSLTRIHHPAVMLFSCPSHCVVPCAQVRALPNGRGGFSRLRWPPRAKPAASSIQASRRTHSNAEKDPSLSWPRICEPKHIVIKAVAGRSRAAGSSNSAPPILTPARRIDLLFSPLR
ncbi:hypothetical protein L1887_48223 [Cichorium endivia]|nr:hypothetical protein L1887_48223 [Cichorium endivia]